MRLGIFPILNCRSWQIRPTTGKYFMVDVDFLFHRDDYQVIMKHLWGMLASKPKEWRRIAKAIHVFDYLCKNGAPRVIQDVKDDLYKIRAFADFAHKEKNGPE